MMLNKSGESLCPSLVLSLRKTASLQPSSILAISFVWMLFIMLGKYSFILSLLRRFFKTMN